MMRLTSLFAAVVVLAIGLSTARANDLYWDTNGSNVGATDSVDGVASDSAALARWNNTSTGLYPDYNSSGGNVDTADYVMFRKNVGSTDPLPNDNATTLPVGTAHYDLWRQSYNANITTFVNGSRAIFSAGTNATATRDHYGVTGNGLNSDVSGNLGTTGTTGIPALSGMLVEEGEINVTGVLTIQSGGIIDVNSGAMLTTSTSANIAMSGQGAGTHSFKYRLNGTGAALKTTNTGFAGSFVSTLATIELNGGGTLYYAGPQINIINPTTPITGTGPLIKDGANNTSGVLAIASASTYTGDTIINAGELRIRTTSERLPATTNVIVNADGILNLNSVAVTGSPNLATQSIASLSGTGQVGTGSGTLFISGANNATFDGVLGDVHNAGAGGSTAVFGRLIKAGANVQTFNGINDLTGSVTLAAGGTGGITVGPSGLLCSPVADLVVNGGTLTLNNTLQQVENLSGTGGAIALASGNVLQTNPSDALASSTTYAGTISGAGKLHKTNFVWETQSSTVANRTVLGSTPSGDYKTLTLTGSNGSWTGGLEVSGGGVRANSATAIGTGAVTINGGGKVDGSGNVAGAITVQSTGHIGGGVGLGDGATTLTADSTVTVESGGNVDAVLGSTAGVSDRLTVSTANALNMQSGSMVTVLGGPAAPAAGSYSVVSFNTGFTGSLANIRLNNATGFDLTGGLSADADSIDVTVSGTAQVRDWTLAGDGSWSADPADDGNWTPAGQPNGPGATANFGTAAHTVTITDSDKTLGTMNLNAGYTIAANGPHQLRMNTYTGNPTINATTNATISAPFVPVKNTTINVDSGQNLDFTNLISNVGGLTKTGDGKMIVSDTGNRGIASPGTVTVSQGTLELTANSIGSGAYTIAAGATLNAFNTADGTGRSATGSSAITNSGTLNIGDGTHLNSRIRGTITTASGGLTNVTGGSLATQALVNTTVTQNGGTLTGNGWAGGISMQGGSTLEPGGIGAVGTLNANGIVSFNPAVAVAGIITMRIDCSASGCDQLNITNNVANTLALPAVAGDSLSIVVNDIGSMADGVYTIINYGAGTTATASGTMANVSVNLGTSTPGHTYTLALDTLAKTINLTIAPPGSGSGLSGGAVPEPSSMVLLIAGLMATAAGRRRR